MKRQKKNKFVLGVTGNIGSGKSTVAAMLKTKDAALIDADKLAHQACSFKSSVYKKIKNCFGKSILKNNNCIDRVKLARIVFSDKAALDKLNSIVHPVVIKKIRQLIKKTNKKIIILDAALIIEAGLRKTIDKLVVVASKRNQQILRSQKCSGLSRNEVIKRMQFQISQSKKERFADFIIDNSGSMNKTKKQVMQIRRVLARFARKDFSG